MNEYERYRRALDGLDAPFAFVDLDAFRANAADLERRAAGGRSDSPRSPCACARCSSRSSRATAGAG